VWECQVPDVQCMKGDTARKNGGERRDEGTTLSRPITHLQVTANNAWSESPIDSTDCTMHLYSLLIVTRLGWGVLQLSTVVFVDQDKPVPGLVGDHGGNSLVDLVHGEFFDPRLDVVFCSELEHVTHDGWGSDGGTGNVDIVLGQSWGESYTHS